MANLTINTDGGARGNPGPAALGVVINNEQGELVEQFSRYLGITTNNQAEYQAVLSALEYLEEHEAQFAEVTAVSFLLDSELVVRQLLRVYRVKDLELAGLFNRAVALIDRLPFTIRFSHVRREQNKRADKLVNIELDKQGKK